VLYGDFMYQAASWDKPSRVVAKVEWHIGEIFPRDGFIVTNISARAKGVVRFYNGDGRYSITDVIKLSLNIRDGYLTPVNDTTA
jgi:hypothetical protein